MSDGVHTLVVPQINVNDEVVQLISWVVESGATVRAGDVVCIVETSKAATEIVTERDGVILPIAKIDEMINVGATLALIGSSFEAVSQAISDPTPASKPQAQVRATSRALALARERGIDLADVVANGVIGTVKESDVERYLAVRKNADESSSIAPVQAGKSDLIPAVLQPRLLPSEELNRHERAVINGLQASLQSVILTTLDYVVGLNEITPKIVEAQRGVAKLSLQHVVIAALGRTLPKFQKLMSFRAGTRQYTYRQVDVAFVVRSLDGRLFTPVVRNADVLDAVEVARACAAASMRVNRGSIAPEELEGACFTVSHIADPAVSRFVALPNRFQSAILAMGGEHESARGTAVNLTLSYDHGLCDGSYAASFLKELSASMRRIVA